MHQIWYKRCQNDWWHELTQAALKFWLTVTHCTACMETTLTVNVYTSSLYHYAKVLAHCHIHGNQTDSECVYQLSLSLC